MKHLTTPQMQLFTEVLQARRPDLMWLVSRAESGSLTPEEREAARSVVLDEFMGELRDDDEPTKRGQLLDGLIGALEKVSPLQDYDLDEEALEALLAPPADSQPHHEI